MSSADFLVEIGTEELPPKALKTLMQAFAENLVNALDEARLAHAAAHAYASPRRLAVVVAALAHAQEDRRISQKGPPENVAFDAEGKPLPPALAFARKCGVTVEELDRTVTDKGTWLSHESLESGRKTADLIAGLVEKALASLPIPRRMRWGSGDAEFVRPVHWIVLLHGDETIASRVMGIKAGNVTRGHRFHSSGPIEILAPDQYLLRLEKDGHVIADFAARRELIKRGVAAAANDAGGAVVNGESLYDEVTALVEWPVPVLGSFDPAFLDLPRETVISTLTTHQRYFPVADESGQLLPKFVTVANLDSLDPDQVREGNERVIRPRLADAAFYWDKDRDRSLESLQESLRDVVYQRGLGSVYDKSARIAALASRIAGALGIDTDTVERAAMLCKCDLVTGMVGEFPDLQGTMGRYYAINDGEPDAVAISIEEHYRPRYAGDDLPASNSGQALAVADKLDTLAGVFAIGKKPSGNRDPFGLRRAALGVVRILIECRLDIDLTSLIDTSLKAQPPLANGNKGNKGKIDPDVVGGELYTFITERLRSYLLDRDSTLAVETFDAVLARQPVSLVDFDDRVQAVQAFLRIEEASSLAAANKRIVNILKQADAAGARSIREKLFETDAEKALFEIVRQSSATQKPLLAERRYAEALTALAALKAPVDRFFDEVMVMAENESVRNNRLALLGELQALFLDVADISRLSIGGS